MNQSSHAEAIENGTFLLICSGETFSSEVVKGLPTILDKMMDAMFGSDKEAIAEWRPKYEASLNDPDTWNTDFNHGPVRWGDDVGETDRIELVLITEPLAAPAKPKHSDCDEDEELI